MYQTSNYLKPLIAQELCGGVDLTKATTFTYKLFSDVVDLDGVGTELTTPEYEQFTFNNNTTNFPPLTDGTSVSAVAMQSADVFSEDATYLSSALFDQSGNMWFRQVETRTILTGQFQKIEAGDIVIQNVWDSSSLEPSDYLKAMLAQELAGAVDLTKATSFVFKLFSDEVDLDGDGTEITTPEYEQFTFANNTTNFPPRTDGKSISDLAEAMASEPFSVDTDIQSIGIYDHADNLWFRKTFAPAAILEGARQYMPADGMRIEIG